MVAGSLGDVKLVSDVVSNVVTIAGVLIGTGWAYWAFLRERTRWPKANLELVMSHRELTADETLINVKVKVHNAGRGLMKLTKMRVDVRQVLPLADRPAEKLQAGKLIKKGVWKADWLTLEGGQNITVWESEQNPERRPEIEPGENDELRSDFVVPSTWETVFIYVYLTNAARKGQNLGWTVTSYYDLTGNETAGIAKNIIVGEAE